VTNTDQKTNLPSVLDAKIHTATTVRKVVGLVRIAASGGVMTAPYLVKIVTSLSAKHVEQAVVIVAIPLVRRA